MNDMIKSYKWYVIGIFIIVIIIMYFALNSSTHRDKESDWTVPMEEEQNTKIEKETNIEVVHQSMLVDVKGAVNQPGVYEVKENERVINIIEKAGGLKEGADEAKINFAQRVTDEMVLYIPLVGEITMNSPITPGGQTISDSTEKEQININTATSEELQNIPGVGPSKAEAIISYRENNGLFQTIEDLKLVSGIGDKTFEKLQEYIRVK